MIEKLIEMLKSGNFDEKSIDFLKENGESILKDFDGLINPMKKLDEISAKLDKNGETKNSETMEDIATNDDAME